MYSIICVVMSLFIVLLRAFSLAWWAHKHTFISSFLFSSCDFYSLPVPGGRKSFVCLRISLKPSPKRQRSRMRMAMDLAVIPDLQMDRTLVFSAHRLVWNYDDTQGAGILFSVLLIRKQEQTSSRRKQRDVCVV